MSKFINVKSNLPDTADGSKLALWENDARHPNGEVFIAGEGVHKVYPTSAVVAKLRSEVLVEVEEEVSEKASKTKQSSKAADEEDEKESSSAVEADKSDDVESDLPEDFPMRGRLIEQGITSFEAVKKMTANDLVALKYIDKKYAQEILDYLKK